MRFRSAPTALADADRLDHHRVTRLRVAATPQRCFDVLATGENQQAWADGYVRTAWLTPAGPASVRDIHMRWVTVTERFLAWAPGRRFAFSADAMSLPLVRRMIEDIAFAPAADGGTDLTWSVHVTFRPWLRPVSTILVDRVFRDMFAGFARGLAQQAER